MMMMINAADGSRMRSKKRIGDRPTDPTRHGIRRSLLQDRLFLCKNATMASKPFFEIAFFDAKMRLWPQQPPPKLTFFDAKCCLTILQPTDRQNLN